MFFFVILSFALLSRLDRLFDWHELPLNMIGIIVSLGIYAKVQPEVVERLEGIFHRHGWHLLLAVTSAAAKLSTYKEDTRKEMEFISEMRHLEAREFWFAQYHGMATKMSRSQGKAASFDDTTADHSNKSIELKNIINDALRDWSIANEKRRQQWHARPNGAWVREEFRKTRKHASEWADAVHTHVGAVIKVAGLSLDISLHTAPNGASVAVSGVDM